MEEVLEENLERRGEGEFFNFRYIFSNLIIFLNKRSIVRNYYVTFNNLLCIFMNIFTIFFNLKTKN